MPKPLTIVVLGIVGIWLIGGFYYQLYRSSDSYVLTAQSNSVFVPAQTRPADVSDVDDPMMTAIKSETEIIVPEDGWITGFSQQVHGAPESALRYTFVQDYSQDDPYCPSWKRIMFVMSVEKVATDRFPANYGYFVKKGTKIQTFSGFANFTDTSYKDAHVTIDLSFVPVSSAEAYQSIYPFFLNAECDSIYAVPPKSTLVKELDKVFTVTMDGRMTMLATHAHKFATDMLLKLNGNELWRTSPVHLPDGTNLGNPVYLAPYNGVPVKKGDLLEWTVTYVNPLDRPTDAMSSIYIQIIPAASTSQELAQMPH